MLQEPEHIAEHITNHFKNILWSSYVFQVSNLVEETIPILVNQQTNNMWTIAPTAFEIHDAVFALNKEGAPDPDGFLMSQ